MSCVKDSYKQEIAARIVNDLADYDRLDCCCALDVAVQVLAYQMAISRGDHVARAKFRATIIERLDEHVNRAEALRSLGMKGEVAGHG